MIIHCYDHNGQNWEYCGLSWEADEFSTDGDFSAFEEGEQIRLVAVRDDGLLAEDDEDAIICRRSGFVRGGKFCDE